MKQKYIAVRDGSTRMLHPAIAEVLKKKGVVRDGDPTESPAEAVATAAPVYQTRMLQADTAAAAPYGFKADGTPRKRPAPALRQKAEDA